MAQRHHERIILRRCILSWNSFTRASNWIQLETRIKTSSESEIRRITLAFESRVEKLRAYNQVLLGDLEIARADLVDQQQNMKQSYLRFLFFLQ